MNLYIFFDKSLETQRSVPANSFEEFPASNESDGYAKVQFSIPVEPETSYPDLSGVRDNRSFMTLNVQTENGVEIPVVGSYNNIASLFVNVTATKYSYTINLNKKAIEA